MSGSISLENFAQAAQHAEKVGGSLDINKDNELVVKGSTWLGRQVQWFKQRVFPDKVRQQNQKVLAALNVTLRSVDPFGDPAVSLDVSKGAKQFAQDVEQVATAHHEQQRLEERQETFLTRGAHLFDELQNRGGFTMANPANTPKALALNNYVLTLEGNDKLEMKAQCAKLLGAVAADKEFGVAGEIPGGSGRSYIDADGGPTGALFIAAYFVAAEAAYSKGGQGKLPEEGAARADRFYGLENKQEVQWLRLKSNTVQ